GVGVGEKQDQKQSQELWPRGKPRVPPTTTSDKTARATRLPADWSLPAEWQQWAVEAHHLEPQRILRISLRFRDHWHAKAGPLAVKLNWFATWRNWIRKELGDV
ncbi:MAG: helix-turn-helix domain-containing protein, partial [Candidatus Dormibacteria bacterium]